MSYICVPHYSGRGGRWELVLCGWGGGGGGGGVTRVIPCCGFSVFAGSCSYLYTVVFRMVVSGVCVCVCVCAWGGGGGVSCVFACVCVCPMFTGFYLGGTLVIVLFLVKNGFRSHCVCVVGGGGGGVVHVVGRGGGCCYKDNIFEFFVFGVHSPAKQVSILKENLNMPS